MRDGVDELMCALDVLVCASGWGEVFPNWVGEARTSAVPCIVAELGPLALLLVEGELVAAGDGKALASAMRCVCSMAPEQRDAMGKAGRQRVVEKWSMSQVAIDYHALYSRAAIQDDAKGAKY